MATETFYPINIASPVQVTRELYTNVGSGINIVGDYTRGFLGGTDFEIWDSAAAGTQLTEGVDYDLVNQNTYYSTLTSPDDTYEGYQISNATYQTGNIYITYKTIGSFTNAQFYNDILQSVTNSPTGLYRNAIINPDGSIDQRQPAGGIYTAATTPANSDDTYLIDRWVLLSDGNDIVDVSQDTDSPDGSKWSIKSLVATANKKWGFLQIIENENSMPLDNGTVSMGFQVKTTTAKLINNVRCAILSWDSTADTVTSDVVSAWNASGADPTLVANWTYENTPANIAVTTSWVDDVSTINVSVDTASMANMAVFIWVDDTDGAVGDELFLSQIRLNEGAVVLPYQPRIKGNELDLCEDSYEILSDSQQYSGEVISGNTYRETVNFRKAKRTASPTITLTDGGVANFPAGAPSVTGPDQYGFRASKTADGTGTGAFVFGGTVEDEL